MGQTRFTPPTPPLQGGEKTHASRRLRVPPLAKGGQGGSAQGLARVRNPSVQRSS